MALQKWGTPAGTPLLVTRTADGAVPNSAFQDAVFGASGDVAIGAVMRITAHGLITTTGTPHLFLNISAFSITPPAAFFDYGTFNYIALPAAAGVTNQPWKVDVLATYDSANIRYLVEVLGLLTTDMRVSELVNVAGVGATIDGDYTFEVGWNNPGPPDSDAGDQIVLHGVHAEWWG